MASKSDFIIELKIGKGMRTQIKPNRYVFHVSHPANRLRIKKLGLFKSGIKNGNIPIGVYAHNVKTLPNYDWYPFVLFGEVDKELVKLYNNEPLNAYDYWRIDTFAIDNKWFLDAAARGDFSLELGYDPGKMYIYTDSNISPNAIQLFRFQNDIHQEFRGVSGAFHIRNSGEFRTFK